MNVTLHFYTARPSDSCVICNESLDKEAVAHGTETENFDKMCVKCAKAWLSKKPTCPICKAPVDNIALLGLTAVTNLSPTIAELMPVVPNPADQAVPVVPAMGTFYRRTVCCTPKRKAYAIAILLIMGVAVSEGYAISTRNREQMLFTPLAVFVVALVALGFALCRRRDQLRINYSMNSPVLNVSDSALAPLRLDSAVEDVKSTQSYDSNLASFHHLELTNLDSTFLQLHQ